MLETERLILRAFVDADREPWAAMNADPEVMRHFPSTLSREEADAVIDRVNGKIAETGVGFWALERKSDGRFLGFAGLNRIAQGAGQCELLRAERFRRSVHEDSPPCGLAGIEPSVRLPATTGPATAD